MSFTIHQATRSDKGTKRPTPYNNGKPRKSKHGGARRGKLAVEWSRWQAMIHRCYSPNTGNYERYGGRGITVCKKWRESYAEFLKDVGKCPSKDHTLDRIDNMGNYEPGNVKWSTRSEQQNNRRANHIVTHCGVSMTLQQWAHAYALNYNTLRHRIKMKWPMAEALTTPPTFHNRKHYV